MPDKLAIVDALRGEVSRGKYLVGLIPTAPSLEINPGVAACSRIVITLEITDPEVVTDYKNTCAELLWEDLVNGDLINFAEFVSRENVTAQASPTTTPK
jgi:hypothetical protein